MGISFGSKSVKPYVGGKEVKEAYVGSQLVYQATYPYKYAFLGTANNYMLADWCTIGQSVAITKYNEIYRIALPYVSDPTSAANWVDLTNIDPTLYKKLKFTAIAQKIDSRNRQVNFAKGNALIRSSTYNFADAVEKTIELDIPAETTRILLIGAQLSATYLDAIRIEE